MRKNGLDSSQVVRVALYIRVSGEEQKIKGLSLEAQQERLEAYAKERGWIISGIYIDAAKTARKNINKRTEFQRMIESVKRDELDILLFCRLDRWFRSVGDYYKIMDILQAHNCEWKTTDEEYDTTTANGRLYINVKLSIAQNESDICGERIDVVFDSKIAHGTVISGSAPFGYYVNKEKRLEIVPDDAAIVKDAFNYYESTISKSGTVRYIRNTYGVNWCDATFTRMLQEELYTGVYNRCGRYNDHFCQPIINRQQFERVQSLIKCNVRTTSTKRVYIFTSILVCNECNHKLSGRQNGGWHYYRCVHHYRRDLCIHSGEIREDVLEEWLFANLGSEIARYKSDWEIRAAKRKRSSTASEKAALKNKLSKLKELYVNDLIDIEEYKTDYDIYSSALQQLHEPASEIPPDFTAIEKMLDSDFRLVYNGLSPEDKRTVWRSAIKEIRIDKDQNVSGIIFW